MNYIKSASVAGVALVSFLFYKFFKKNLKSNEHKHTNNKFKKVNNETIEMESLMNNINHSQELYKKLIRVCHPDRYVNHPKQSLAQKLFQEISSNKRNYSELSKIKIEFEKEFEIIIS